MNPAELNYTAVSTFDQSEKGSAKMESGKAYRQFMTAAVSNVASIAIGTTLGWTSPSIPKLTSSDFDINPLGRIPSKDEQSWIGSLVALGAVFAPWIIGPLTGMYGRKWSLMSCAAFFGLSFFLLGFGKSVEIIYVARILQGLGVGIAMTVLPMYIGEIASKEYRGALGSFMQLFIVSGILFVYVVGPYVSYAALQFICLIFPIGFAVGMFFMPDTPNYFLSKGLREEANQSLRFLRGKSDEGVKGELAEIEASVVEAQQNRGSITDIFTNKGNLKAIIICAGLITFQQLSGINVVLFNSQSIFEKTGSSLEPAIATIMVGAVQVLASGCTPLVVERLGRKLILLFSAGGMALSLATMGLFFYLDAIASPARDKILWLPVASLIIFVSVYCVGFGPLPWAVLGEMFPVNVKSFASTIVASVCWIFGFLITKYFESVSDALGTHWAFWIFSICCVAAFTFTFTLVMETKGLSLQEIQNRLNKRS